MESCWAVLLSPLLEYDKCWKPLSQFPPNIFNDPYDQYYIIYILARTTLVTPP